MLSDKYNVLPPECYGTLIINETDTVPKGPYCVVICRRDLFVVWKSIVRTVCRRLETNVETRLIEAYSGAGGLVVTDGPNFYRNCGPIYEIEGKLMVNMKLCERGSVSRDTMDILYRRESPCSFSIFKPDWSTSSVSAPFPISDPLLVTENGRLVFSVCRLGLFVTEANSQDQEGGLGCCFVDSPERIIVKRPASVSVVPYRFSIELIWNREATRLTLAL